MPRDSRLYMTFPIDMHRHPKLMRLPAEVRWTFFEMNGEARIADNDGVFAADEAEFLWPDAHLHALLKSHPTKPLLVMDGDTYVIREYAEHQFTKEDRERLAQISRENGAKGGRPSKPRETHVGSEITQPEPRGTQTKPGRTQTKPESGSESGLERTTDITHPSLYVTEVNARDAEDEEWIASEALVVGIKDLPRARKALERVVGPIEMSAVVIDLARDVFALSKGHVKYPESYLEKTALNSPHEVLKLWEAIK